MTEPANEAAKTAQDPKGEPREAVSVGQLNELTAKRQRMLLAPTVLFTPENAQARLPADDRLCNVVLA